ncbi:MAG: ribosomal-processing cysteine protease Prp [Clostridia bacterium]|nr:ribosomal-processing cysteine protease Prp [Clostridia bacterium]
MTKVIFCTDINGELVGFHIHGHSGYAEEGEDIVCAAVSSAAYMVMNTITDVMHIDAQVSADDESGDAVLRILSENAAECRYLLQGFKLHMLCLEEQYNKFISVKNTEV